MEVLCQKLGFFLRVNQEDCFLLKLKPDRTTSPTREEFWEGRVTEAVLIPTPPHKEAGALDKKGRPRTGILERVHMDSWTQREREKGDLEDNEQEGQMDPAKSQESKAIEGQMYQGCW